MNKRIFQVLVIVDIALSVVAGVYDYLFGIEASSKVIEFVASIEPEGSVIHFYAFSAYASVVLVMALASIVGLLRFRIWGRKLYVASFALAVLVYPFSGVSVFSGLGQLFNDSSFVLSGFLLAVMFFSPLKREFK